VVKERNLWILNTILCLFNIKNVAQLLDNLFFFRYNRTCGLIVRRNVDIAWQNVTYYREIRYARPFLLSKSCADFAEPRPYLSREAREQKIRVLAFLTRSCPSHIIGETHSPHVYCGMVNQQDDIAICPRGAVRHDLHTP
jgi:hypothetical protein